MDKAASQRSVLVVDDDPASLDMVSSCLSGAGYHVHQADNAVHALAIFANHSEKPIQLVLSDWMMPGMSGLDLCRHIRASQAEQMVYFVMLTVHSDKDRLTEAFDQGVDDYLSKPFYPGELLGRMRAGSRIVDLYEQVRSAAVIQRRNNEELTRLNERLSRCANVDELTKLLNRRQAMIRIHEQWTLSERYGQPLSVAMVDVDHFKRVNDTFGHLKGDEVLQRLATVLSSSVRQVDQVFRIGGEEFLILLPQQTAREALICCERCRSNVVASISLPKDSQKNTQGDPIQSISVSVGIAEFPGKKTPAMQGPDDLLKAADQAMYAAKNAGRNRVEIFQNVPSPALC